MYVFAFQFLGVIFRELNLKYNVGKKTLMMKKDKAKKGFWSYM